jgi:6-phosphogluconolactonase
MLVPFGGMLRRMSGCTCFKLMPGTGMMKNVVMRAVSAAGAGVAMLLTGCNGFFVDPNTGTGTTTTGSSTADYVYTVNNGDTLSEFVVGSSVLTPISGSPIALSSFLAGASSVAVSTANAYVFVGGASSIQSFAIGTTGALTQVSVTGGLVTEANANFVSLDVSPNGQWLLALDAGQNAIWLFAIDTSTGALTLQGSAVPLSVAAGTAPAKMIRISPNGGLLAVAIGAQGDNVFTFDQTTGGLSTTPTSSVNALSSGSDDSVTFDSTSGFLLVGRGITTAGSSSIVSYAVSAAGVLGAVKTYASGQDPFSLLVDSTGGFLYAANKGDDTVSAYTLASGVPTVVMTSPYKSGTGVTSLAEDINSKYVIAASAGGSSDLTLYALDALTPGQLDAVGTAANGSSTAGSIAVAATHPQ